MMLRERWRLIAVLGIGVALASCVIAQQTVRRPKIVTPSPEQAEQPDLSTSLPAGQQEQFPEPQLAPPAEVPKPAPPEPVEEPKPEPQAAAPVESKPAPKPEPKPEPPAILANTPEGRQLQEQTATLLQLTRELKTELEKAGNNTLSIAALRKVDQIQRMTRNLREEMSHQGQMVDSK